MLLSTHTIFMVCVSVLDVQLMMCHPAAAVMPEIEDEEPL